MGDVLFSWTATYQTCLMRACVPRLVSGLYQLFDLCLIKHISTVWSRTSKSACLVTKQCLMVFGPQTFPVCPGPYANVVMIIRDVLTQSFSSFLTLSSLMFIGKYF